MVVTDLMKMVRNNEGYPLKSYILSMVFENMDDLEDPIVFADSDDLHMVSTIGILAEKVCERDGGYDSVLEEIFKAVESHFLKTFGVKVRIIREDKDGNEV